MKKTIQYAFKTSFGLEPIVVDRATFKAIITGDAVTRRHRMMDNTRVFGLASGTVVYMQYQTAKQVRHWA